jgi:uncharacterized protein YdeI (YjbR/CyaY-like superfamily)
MAIDEDPILSFRSPQAWTGWLAKNHRTSGGIWMQIAKKGAEATTVSYAEALEIALCYGWIDGQKRALDASHWLQRFVPRTIRSIWSRINREKAEAMIAQGRMQPAGHEAIEQAKNNGRWDSAYDGPQRSTAPPDFQAALDAHPEAKAFFETLNSANRYALLFRIQTVKKAETRARKIVQFVEMLARQEKFHP